MALPIRQLTLYKHGISVVERGGSVTGESATLTFHRDQMNDVLKSLVAFDRGGGQIRNIAYDAPEEREAKLQRGSIHLSDDATLLSLLRDLRGRAARVYTRREKEHKSQQYEGLVVGLDIDQEEPYKHGRLSLLTGQGIQVLALREVIAVEPMDAQSRDDLAFFLRASIAEPEQRTVTLRLSEGEHDLVVRYLAPSPTWRVSYRLVGEREGEGERRALLQGWGIFDNPFDEPLESVSVSLVAGMPISFIYDLYTPFTPERPVVQEEARVAAAPVELERRARPKQTLLRAAMAAPAPEAMPVYSMRGEEADAGMRFALSADALAASTAIGAQGEAMGDLFEYRIAHPVTVQRGEAAMVPILGTEIPYRKEFVYNGQKQPRNPVVVLRFDNKSDLTLERGPITVLEGDTYIGEAIFPFTRPGAEVLLAVAVDLGVSVREERKIHREMHQIVLREGFLVFEQYLTQESIYEVSNTNSDALTLLIEHWRNRDFTLVGMDEPFETTESHYRWKVEVPEGPEGFASFTVRERRMEERREQLTNLTDENLRRYLRQNWLDQALASGLKELIRLLGQKQRVEERLEEIEEERARLMANQEQARKNMSGLKESGDEGSLRARYVRQMNEAEDALALLDKERGRLRQEEASLDEQVDTQIDSLE